MQAAELREILDEMARIHGEEALEEIEVRFAGQPNWPFEFSILSNIVEREGVIYLAELSQLSYLPGDVGEELDW